MTTKRRKPKLTGSSKILIPVGDLVSKELITRALHLLSSFGNSPIVLLHIIEVPSRTATLDPDPYLKEIKAAEKRLSDLSEWLTRQGMSVKSKVAVARSAAEGIVTETENDSYMIVFMMKRQIHSGWRRLFSRSVSERVVRSANCLVMTAPLGQLSKHVGKSSKH
jgi:nucleotide-binding universal stress UspA family protein